MKSISFCLVFLVLMLPLALATTIPSDLGNYASGSNVLITGSCTNVNVPVALQMAIGINNILYTQTTSIEKTFTYNYLPPQNGKYTLLVACNNEKAVSTTFCVGSGCPTTIVPPPEDNHNTPSSSGGGGGSSCTPIWDCDVWTVCNTTLKQARSCTDTKNCRAKTIEVRNCTPCTESWTCSGWSECNYNNLQTRTCKDDRDCGTAQVKPDLSRVCEVETSYTQQTYTPPKTITKPKAPVVPTLSFWQSYRNYILGGVAFLLLLVIIMVIIFVLHKKRNGRLVYDLNELKNWIGKERGAGTSDDDIKKILSQSTGWKENEVMAAFSELRGFASNNNNSSR